MPKVMFSFMFMWLLWPQQTFAQDPWFVRDLAVDSLKLLQSTKPTVVIVGDGIDCAHPSIKGRVDEARSKSFVDNSPCISGGHEVGIANTFLAIDSRTKIVSLKVYGSVGTPTNSLSKAVVATFEEIERWDEDFVVVNTSFAEASGNGDLLPILKRLEKKVLVVVAAGNTASTTVHSPCYYGYELSNVLCVGAIDNQGKLWYLSNRGPRVELGAFGVGLYGPLGTGTSFSAPVVTGLAELLYGAMRAKGYNPTPGLLKKILIEGSLFNQNLTGLLGNPRQANGANLMAMAAKVMSPWSITIQSLYSEPRAGDPSMLKIFGAPISIRQLKLIMSFKNESGSVIKIEPTFVENDSVSFIGPKTGRYWLSFQVEGMIETNEVPITILPARQPHVMPNSIGSSNKLSVAQGQEVILLIPGFRIPSSVESWIKVPGDEEEDWRELVFVGTSFSTEAGFFEVKFQLPAKLTRGVASLILRVDGQFVDTPVQVFVKSVRHRPERL